MFVNELTKFIYSMISSGPKVSKAEIIAFFGFDLKLKWSSVLSSMWKISILKNICTGL